MIGFSRKHTWQVLRGFLRFGGRHVVVATVAVVRVVWSKLSSSCDTALLLSRCNSVGGNLGKLLGAFVGVMTHSSTFIAGYC